MKETPTPVVESATVATPAPVDKKLAAPVVVVAPAPAAKKAAPTSAPASNTLLGTKAKDAAEWAKWSQNFDVPIDEVKAITLNVSPTYDLDHVESVTLKSFRKVVGYDTFNSILKKDRDEKKDTSDYYNVTVSMMIRRIPEDVAHPPTHDPYNPTGVTLSSTLDKGFPYDDGDNTTDDQTPNWKGGARPKSAQLVGKLNGENITKDALVNLIRDTDAPITQSLLQLDESKADSDNVSTLFDSNVTRGNLKNLVTDKPAPITVALAQKSDGDNVSTLFDSNVTRGNLKNLVTDKPAPITVALAQKADSDNVSTLFDSNVTRGNLKNLVTDKPAPITVALLQLEKSDSKSAAGVPVLVNPVIAKNTEGEADLGLKMVVGPDEVSVKKRTNLAQVSNPVNNPPFNNWSVNQPSVPHDHGLAGKADLGQNIIVDGHNISYAQKAAGKF